VHHIRQLFLVHLPVRDPDAGFRHQILQVVIHRGDGLHAVVHKEHLPAAVQLANDRLAHQFRVVRSDVRDNWQPFLGR